MIHDVGPFEMVSVTELKYTLKTIGITDFACEIVSYRVSLSCFSFLYFEG